MMSNAPVRHPAAFSREILQEIDGFISSWRKTPYRMVLDPFGGIGKLRQILPDAIINELEPEWMLRAGCPGTIGDACHLPFSCESFDAVITSPVYGNRMSDSFIDHQPQKRYKRNTYTHAIGRALDKRNAGKLQWGLSYRLLHVRAWFESWRVLRYGGLFILNISDHVRRGEIMPVSEWHRQVLLDTGFNQVEHLRIATRRNGFGENRSLRVDHENIYIFCKEIPF